MNKKLWLTLISAGVLGLASCGGNEIKNSPSVPKDNNTRKIDPNVVPIFIMSGQSNMEGSTNWRYKDKDSNNKERITNLLEQEMTALGEDYSVIDPDKESTDDGVENVLCSYYGFYYPNKWEQAHTASKDTSTPEARMTPNFMPTTVGMGVGDNGTGDYFGPEVGLAYKLSSNYEGEQPIHLIKCAFSGSGFEKTDGPNWKTMPDDTKTDSENASASLYFLLKKYTDNCLKVIEDQGLIPEIKGFIWHQGESDTDNKNYQTQMEKLISDVRNDYADYAKDKDGKNIAFLDCTIYDGSKNRYGSQKDVNDGINKLKNNIAAKGKLDKNDTNYEPNFIVDGTFTDSGLKLEIGDAAKGGYNMYHYNTKDAFILGEAYADIIIDNELLY